MGTVVIPILQIRKKAEGAQELVQVKFLLSGSQGLNPDRFLFCFAFFENLHVNLVSSLMTSTLLPQYE